MYKLHLYTDRIGFPMKGYFMFVISETFGGYKIKKKKKILDHLWLINFYDSGYKHDVNF